EPLRCRPAIRAERIVLDGRDHRGTVRGKANQVPRRDTRRLRPVPFGERIEQQRSCQRPGGQGRGERQSGSRRGRVPRPIAAEAHGPLVRRTVGPRVVSRGTLPESASAYPTTVAAKPNT